MKDIQLTVYDKQIYDTHSDENEKKYVGQITSKGDSVYITYKDQEQDGTTLIKAKGNKVSVKRYGSVKADLYFDPSNTHKTIYYTPYGEMEIEIITKNCDIYILEKAIKINIEYSIYMQGSKVSDNVYLIMAN